MFVPDQEPEASHEVGLPVVVQLRFVQLAGKVIEDGLALKVTVIGAMGLTVAETNGDHPLAFAHCIEKVVPEFILFITCVLSGAVALFIPAKLPPPAIHKVGLFVVVHVRVDDNGDAPVVGLAVKVTTGLVSFTTELIVTKLPK
jgi:hypothetical protein